MPVIREAKNCKDCKFYRRDIPFFFDKELGHCVHPSADTKWAIVTRKYDCGKRSARWFEAKPPRFQWLRKLFEKPQAPVPEFDFAERPPKANSWR